MVVGGASNHILGEWWGWVWGQWPPSTHPVDTPLRWDFKSKIVYGFDQSYSELKDTVQDEFSVLVFVNLKPSQ